MGENIEAQETSENPAEVVATEETATEQVEAPQQSTEVRDGAQLLARVKKAEAEAKRLREAVKEAVLEDEDKTEKEVPEGKIDPLDAVADALGLIRDMEPEEVTALRDEARLLGISQADFIKSKAGKAYLTAFRHEQEVARTTPPPSSKGGGNNANATDEKPSRFPTVAEWKASKQNKRGNE